MPHQLASSRLCSLLSEQAKYYDGSSEFVVGGMIEWMNIIDPIGGLQAEKSRSQQAKKELQDKTSAQIRIAGWQVRYAREKAEER